MPGRRVPLLLLLVLSALSAGLLRRAWASGAARAACEEGERLEARGLFAEAAQSFETCLRGNPKSTAAWRAWAEALLRARGRPAYDEVRSRLRRFVETARHDPRTDRVELQAIEELIVDLEDLLEGESPAVHSGPWTVEEIVEILSREGLRGPSRYDGPRLPVRLDFRPEDTTLGQTAKEQLREVAEALRDGLLRGVPIDIEGHTDSVEAGTEAGRLALASRRAEAVRNFLVQRHGIPARQLHIKALADRYPLQANSSPEGRAANRRVELVNLESKQPLLKDIRSRD